MNFMCTLLVLWTTYWLNQTSSEDYQTRVRATRVLYLTGYSRTLLDATCSSDAEVSHTAAKILAHRRGLTEYVQAGVDTVVAKINAANYCRYNPIKAVTIATPFFDIRFKPNGDELYLQLIRAEILQSIYDDETCEEGLMLTEVGSILRISSEYPFWIPYRSCP